MNKKNSAIRTFLFCVMQTDDSNTIFQANLNKSIDSGAISCKDLQVMLKWHFDVELHNDTGCDGKTN